MLVRLMYASRNTVAVEEEQQQAQLQAIAAKSRASNSRCGITGVLCCSGEVYVQVLEGGRTEVNALYNRIIADSRHHDVVLLSYEEIRERRFVGWSMGQVNLARVNPSLLLKYSERAVLDPTTLSASAAMALFEELLATASIGGQGS